LFFVIVFFRCRLLLGAGVLRRHKAMIDAVREVTHIAHADADGKLAGLPAAQEGVVHSKAAGKGKGVTNATCVNQFPFFLAKTLQPHYPKYFIRVGDTVFAARAMQPILLVFSLCFCLMVLVAVVLFSAHILMSRIATTPRLVLFNPARLP
jgi:hypothetical protein